jgi:hypothetical protein
MPETEYQRLTRLRRRGGNFFQRAGWFSNLWLGRDHLLSIDSNLMSEQYKRFYFRDIQAFTIVKTRRKEAWNFTLVMLLVFFGSFFINGSVVSGVWAAIAGLGLVLNNILGTTCTVYLRTAVQVEELSSLCRLRRARKVLARIRPLIEAAQGQLAPAEASDRVRELFESSPGARPAKTITSPLNLSG